MREYHHVNIHEFMKGVDTVVVKEYVSKYVMGKNKIEIMLEGENNKITKHGIIRYNLESIRAYANNFYENYQLQKNKRAGEQ